jgi:hypothetical protein
MRLIDASGVPRDKSNPGFASHEPVWDRLMKKLRESDGFVTPRGRGKPFV